MSKLLFIHTPTEIVGTCVEGGKVRWPDGATSSPAEPGMTRKGWTVSTALPVDPIPAGKEPVPGQAVMQGGVPVQALEDAPPVYATAGEAHEAMIAWADAFNRTVTGPVPADEKLAWVYKDAAARAIDAGTADAAQLALIDDEAAITGETREELAAKIIVKSNLYRQVVAAVSGLRRKSGAAIDAASDPYQYEVILAAAQAEAAALATSLGL